MLDSHCERYSGAMGRGPRSHRLLVLHRVSVASLHIIYHALLLWRTTFWFVATSPTSCRTRQSLVPRTKTKRQMLKLSWGYKNQPSSWNHFLPGCSSGSHVPCPSRGCRGCMTVWRPLLLLPVALAVPRRSVHPRTGVLAPIGTSMPYFSSWICWCWGTWLGLHVAAVWVLLISSWSGLFCLHTPLQHGTIKRQCSAA